MSKFNQITPEIIDQLKSAVPGRVYVGEDINVDYSHDEMPGYGKFMPDVVVDAVSTEEVAAIMKICNDNLIPVVPRGAGTGLVGGAVAIAGGVMISTTKMNKILGYDEANMTVDVQAGVLLNDLAEDALKRGYLYPPDPGEKFATLGGNVSTNAGGMRAVKYGVTRQYVRSMTVVLPTGEIVKFGRNVAKTSSGYSLLHLMIGSEGTLGLITEMTLKLIPAPKETISLIVPFEDLATAIHTVPVVMSSRLNPQAIEFMEKQIVRDSEAYLKKEVFPRVIDGVEAGAYLLMTFDGDNMEQLEELTERASEVVLEAGAIDVLVADTPELKRNAWAARSSLLEALESTTEELDECDVVVPIDKIPEFIVFADEMQRKYDIRIVTFGHAGDGNVHVDIARDKLNEEDWKAKNNGAQAEMYKKAVELGGMVSGEHGIGHGKIDYLKESLGETSIRLMQGIKDTFDPNGILNPGKVCYKL
ncbi:MAG: FAD-binding oxidoreductase [Clostridiales bacterium]|nr:FAD-binding oxidoreductase [Clostridiales bacterium]